MNLKCLLTAASGAIISCFAVHEHLEKVRLESELFIVKLELEMVSGVAREQELQISTLSNQLENISVLDVVTATYDRLYNKATTSSFFVYFTSNTVIATTNDNENDNDNDNSIPSASTASTTTTQSVEDLVPPDPPSSTSLSPPSTDKSSSSDTMIIKTTTEIFTSMYHMITCESHFGLLVCNKHTSMYRMLCACESHLGLLVLCTSMVLVVVVVVVFVYYNKDPVSRQVIQRFVTNLPTMLSSNNMQAMMRNVFKFGCSVLTLFHQVIGFVINAFCDCLHKMSSSSSCMALYERAKSILHVAIKTTAMKQECRVISSLLPFTMKNGLLFLMMMLVSIQLYWTRRENQLAVASLVGMWIVYKSGMFLITQHLRFIKVFIWLVVIAMAKHEMWNENNTVLYRLWILLIAIAMPLHCLYLVIVDCFGRWARLMRYMFFGNQIGQFIIFVIHCVTFALFPPAAIVLAVFTWMVYKKLCRVEVQGLEAKEKHGNIFNFGFVASHVTTMMNT